MKRAIAIALLVAGCLSRGNEEEPRGGADITLFPSDATKGKPFVTPDGWTVTIHTFAMRAAGADTTVDAQGNPSGGGPGPARILVPSPQCHLRISGADVGVRAGIGVITQATQPNAPDSADDLAPCGVDADTLKRFSAYADDAIPDYPSLPSLFVDATATRDGQTLEVSFTVSGGAYSNPGQDVQIVVQANVGIPVSFPINAELFFAPLNPTGVTFDEIAYCDKNNDGKVTGPELAAFPRTCSFTSTSDGDDDDTDGGLSQYCSNVLADLNTNVNDVFGAGVTP